VSVLPEKRNVVIHFLSKLMYSLNKKKLCLFALKCVKVKDNNI